MSLIVVIIKYFRVWDAVKERRLWRRIVKSPVTTSPTFSHGESLISTPTIFMMPDLKKVMVVQR